MEFGLWGRKAKEFIKTPPEKDSFINILEGSVRSGKTVAMIPKWLNYILTGPPGLLLMTGVSKDTVYDNVLSDIFDTIGQENYQYNRQNGDLLIKWHDGKDPQQRRIKVLGAKDEGSEKFLRGKTLAGAYCDELTTMPEHFFKQLLNRLSVKGARLYATTNPDAPFHYLYQEYIINEEKQKSGLVHTVHFELDDNPNLSEEYKRNIRASYSGMWFARMILGEWVLAEGIIYDMFGADKLYSDAEFDATMKSVCRRYIAIDYGTTNPCVFLDILDDGDTIRVHDEYYWDSKREQRQKTDGEYCEDLKKFIGEEYPDAVIIDPSAASFKLVLLNAGLRVQEADNEVNDGIRMVGMMMKKRRLLIHERCKNLRDEMQGYIWDEKAAQRGEEKPVKFRDHGCDALRYYVKTRVKRWRLEA